MNYVKENHKTDECIFCAALNSGNDEENLVFYRGEHVFMILNRYPYTSGHVMCVPKIHEAELPCLSREARIEMMDLINKAVQVLDAVYHPEGFNIGWNLGEVAGAGIANHLHAHIVPRWCGDTSFMTTVGETRVIPESVKDTYRRVKEAWESYKE
jgi:ATP adenylyltransferase